MDMKKTEFYEMLIDELELKEEKLDENTEFKNLGVWDSMASLILISVADENFGVKISSEKLKELTTVRSLMETIGYQNFE